MTKYPSTQPTRQPATTSDNNDDEIVRICTAEGNLFGSPDGDPWFLEFGYEVETNPDDINGSFSATVLPPLEAAFNSFLLPSLFPEICREAGVETSRRRLRVVGISAVPVDEPRPEIPCELPVQPGNTCLVVRGSLILFFSGSEDTIAIDQDVRDQLKLGMDTDAFVPAHPSIARVTFVDLDNSIDRAPTASPSVDNAREVSGGESSGLDSDDIVLPVVLALAAVVILVAGTIAGRNLAAR